MDAATEPDQDLTVARGLAAAAALTLTDDELTQIAAARKQARESMARLRLAIDATEEPAAVFAPPREPT